MNTDLLVSVCVITYNSSTYVLETLESIKMQTYLNIELIICDDCSNDDTVRICKNWLMTNSWHFVNTQLIESEKNTGIAPNANRGYMAARGKWIKGIAGDDVLSQTCIEKNVLYVQTHQNVEVLQSYNQYIDSNSEFIGCDLYKKDDFFFKESTTAYSQYKILLRKYVSNTVSTFIKRESFVRVGGFDDSIKMLEDYPMWLKLTANGIKIYFMEEVTALYRIHDQSISVGGNQSLKKILPPIIAYNLLVKKKYIIPNLSGVEKWIALYMVFITKSFMNSTFNCETKINLTLWKILQFPSCLINKIVLNKIYNRLSKI